jgi:lipoprotein-anchoring transpeptidase ErfK/SrfK
MSDAMRPPNDALMWLRRGLRAMHAGDRAQAKRCFQSAHDAEPDNIVVLLWQAWLADDREECLVLLNHVLELDPHNQRARAGIRWARQRPYFPSEQAGPPDEAIPAMQEEVPGALYGFQEPPGEAPLLQKRRAEVAQVERPRRRLRLLGLLVVVGLIGIGLLLLARYMPGMTIISSLAAPSPTMTSAPSDTPTATPTGTPTPTTTSSPTATISPTYTTTSSPSATTTHTPSPSSTPTSTDTPTLTPLPTSTPTPTGTATPVPVPTHTTTPTASPTLISAVETPGPTPGAPVTRGTKWIDVNLTKQQLTAYEGTVPVFQATVSTGLPGTLTVVGSFNIYWKLVASDMSGPGYYLANVPYIMYFHRGYAICGSYWRSNSGYPMGGCISLRTEDAKWIFDWAGPVLLPGNKEVRASPENPGTLVVIHH